MRSKQSCSVARYPKKTPQRAAVHKGDILGLKLASRQLLSPRQRGRRADPKMRDSPTTELTPTSASQLLPRPLQGIHQASLSNLIQTSEGRKMTLVRPERPSQGSRRLTYSSRTNLKK